MAVYLNHIVNEVPDHRYTQSFVRDFLKEHITMDRKSGLAIHHIYKNSGIDARYSVIPDFSETYDQTGLFFNPDTRTLNSPTTGERNHLYEIEAKKLYTRLSSRLISEIPKLDNSKITHVITVSCTGFYAPGPDLDVVKFNGLNPSVQRFHIGFMGCYAAFPAFRLAKSICEATPDAIVLIVSVELCTLHLKFQTDTDSMISTSVFADGGAATLVSTQRDLTPDSGYEIDGLESIVTENGAEDMAWSIGDNGFDMILSTYIPDLLASNIRNILMPIMDKHNVQYDEVDLWAIHPGGRAILDKISAELNIDESKFTPSRDVLREYGNMSSATILFVLNKMRELKTAADQSVLGMAFGPGLTVETGLFKLFSNK
jgi:predicted naringenin-chalcone synthase